MIIDWTTIIFQIINFLVLVFLLRKFLYGPIIKTMDEREQKIVEREEVAAAQKKEAEEEAETYRQKREKLEQQKEEIHEKALKQAEKEKRDLLDKARREVEETKQRWEESFEREKETFITELRSRIGQQACAISRRCLQDLADAKLEELIWNLFLKKIADLPGDERSKLKKALTADESRVELYSAFETPGQKVDDLEKILKELVSGSGDEVDLVSKVEQSLICGLELHAGGYRIAWSIDSYLEDLEAQILKDLDKSFADDSEEEVSGGDDGGE